MVQNLEIHLLEEYCQLYPFPPFYNTSQMFVLPLACVNYSLSCMEALCKVARARDAFRIEERLDCLFRQNVTSGPSALLLFASCTLNTVCRNITPPPPPLLSRLGSPTLNLCATHALDLGNPSENSTGTLLAPSIQAYRHSATAHSTAASLSRTQAIESTRVQYSQISTCLSLSLCLWQNRFMRKQFRRF